MGRKTVQDNFRVEVVPRSFSYRERTEKEARSDCEAIADQIRRHVDGLPSHGDRGVIVTCDSKSVCEHCGAVWSEEGNFNGGCCAKDMENEPVDDLLETAR